MGERAGEGMGEGRAVFGLRIFGSRPSSLRLQCLIALQDVSSIYLPTVHTHVPGDDLAYVCGVCGVCISPVVCGETYIT